jgi:Druantia protein DruA
MARGTGRIGAGASSTERQPELPARWLLCSRRWLRPEPVRGQQASELVRSGHEVDPAHRPAATRAVVQVCGVDVFEKPSPALAACGPLVTIAITFASARDRYIGWSLDARRSNLRLLAYNSRFLILPWVKVPHLASHLLGHMARRLSSDWERLYAHPIYFAETFVDLERNRGTCCRAANWVVLGMTTGRGKDAATWKQNRSKKQVLGLPLVRDFRERLSRLG